MQVVIVGSGRSGTSMVTRMLNLCGLYIGEPREMYSTGDFDNPRGYWEHRGIYAINDKIIQYFNKDRAADLPYAHGQAGVDWIENVVRRAGIFRLPQGWEDDPGLSQLYSEAREIVGRQFTDKARWGWKDPRGSLTIPFWRKVDPNIRFVVCVRNPIDGSKSFEKHFAGHGLGQFKFSGVHGYMDWYYYNCAILTATRPDERILTHFEDYREDYRSALNPVLEFLGLRVVTEGSEVDRAIQEYHSADLMHYGTSTEQVLASPDLPDIAKHLYAGMISPDTKAMADALDEARVAAPLAALVIEQAVEAARTRIPEVDAVALNERTLALQSHIDHMDSVLADRERHIAILLDELENRNAHIGKLDAHIDGLNKRVGELSASAGEMAAILQSRTHRIADMICKVLIKVRHPSAGA